MKKTLFTALLLLVTGINSASAQTTLFQTTESLPYRIPAIVQTSNNEILVFSDKRWGGGDVGQTNNKHIDIVYKRFSNGKWDNNETLVIEGNESFGYGDVAVVADRENPDEIVFFTAAGSIFFSNSKNKDGERLQCYRFNSDDGGKTWSYTNVTTQIYGLKSYNGMFFSSGRICQSSKIKVGSHYRLYAALCVTGTNSLVIYSDNFGEEWNVLGNTPAVSGGNEAKCEELPNGNVLVSSRAAGTRYFNIFSYSDQASATGSWESNHSSGIEMAYLSNNETNGEILIVKAVDTSGNPCDIALQSVPFGSEGEKFLGFIERENNERTNVSIYWKKLPDGKFGASEFSDGWERYPVSTTTSAYSTMIQLTDGTIAFAYEENYRSVGKGGYNIQYQNLSIETITGNAYKTPSYNVTLNECTVGGEDMALATFSAPVSTLCPSGVSAYYIKDMNNGYAKLEAIGEGKTIPANTGVILAAEEAGSCTLIGANVFVDATIGDNLLVGSSNSTVTFSDTVKGYILMGDGDGGVAFYSAQENTTLGKNKAYLKLDTPASSTGVRISFDGTTDIEFVEHEQEDAEPVIYDLYGRRVNEMQPGNIYIVNGKKILKK